MPDKSIAEVSRVWREQYEKGVTAFQRQNFDYAVDLLTQVLEKEPAFFEARQALRATQFKRSGEKTSFFKKMLGTAGSSPLLAKAQFALRSNPVEALALAEQILNGDPNSSSGHKIVVEAALAADFPKAAILSLEILTKNSRDTDLLRQLADAYIHTGQTAKADALYQELLRSNPTDPELNQAYKNLSAHRTMNEQGYQATADSGGSYRDLLRNKDEAVSLEQEKRGVKSVDVATRLIGEYEAQLAAEPQNLKLMRNIAELYKQQATARESTASGPEREVFFDQAVAYFRHILEVSGTSDPAVEKAITETTLQKYDFALTQLDPAAPDYAERHAQIQTERAGLAIAQLKDRVERYPTDLQLRFELGQLYFTHGLIGEAIQELQKAQANPHRRLPSLSLLGQCFARRNMNDLAARTLQNALKEKLVFDDEKKELIYHLGCVLEKMGKREEAMDALKQIYEVDIGYKDVAAKVDAYYSGQ